jgi:hypothetical protein
VEIFVRAWTSFLNWKKLISSRSDEACGSFFENQKFRNFRAGREYKRFETSSHHGITVAFLLFLYFQVINYKDTDAPSRTNNENYISLWIIVKKRFWLYFLFSKILNF